LRSGTGVTFMVGPGRHVASLHQWGIGKAKECQPRQMSCNCWDQHPSLKYITLLDCLRNSFWQSENLFLRKEVRYFTYVNFCGGIIFGTTLMCILHVFAVVTFSSSELCFFQVLFVVTSIDSGKNIQLQ